LHDIVVLAQELLPQLPERERLPTNSLFAAYDDILPRIGVDADHDSRYARVLFKIGGLRGPGTLYEKFEEILSRMGIEIEFDAEDNEDNDEQYIQLEESQAGRITARDQTPPQDENVESRGRRRRNSENSAWDLGNDNKSQPRTRRSSLSFTTKGRTDKETRPRLQEAPPRRPSPTQRSPSRNRNEVNPQHNVGAWLNSRLEKPRKSRGRSISTHGSMRIRRRSNSAANRRHQRGANQSHPASDDYQATSEITAVTSGFGDDPTVDSTHSFRRQTLDPGPGSLMQIKASIVLQHHLEFLAKQQLQHWRGKALQLRGHNIDLDQVALSHDKKALLVSAFDCWRLRLKEIRDIAATERFFSHCERRAEKARNLYLLHKAFTYWATRSDEQVQRTARARRHIIRTRIFNAWREITAINELKVRRHVLRKFFSLWTSQYAANSSDSTVALHKFQGNLVEKVFLQWLRKLWDIRATAQWAGNTKRKTLFGWIVISHKAWQNQYNAEETKRHRLLLNTWRVWRTTTDTRVQRIQEAETYYHIRLCHVALQKWRGENRVIPPKHLVQTDVAGRLIRETFDIWLHRSREESRATSTDRMRMMQEAWTNWRHKLRLKVMRDEAERGLKLRTIYQWQTVQRTAIFQRELNRKRTFGILQTWKEYCLRSREQRWSQEDLAKSYAVQKVQNSVLRHWYSHIMSRKRLEVTALEFHSPRLLQGIISRWSNQTEHVRQLEQWSQDAEFYFLTSQTMKKWKIATESAKREKRKSAYTQVRRMTKMNLGRGALQTWRQKARHVLDLQAHALDTRRNKTIIVGMDIFDRWRARAEELGELESLWRELVLRKHFNMWKNRSYALQALDTEAIITWQERRQNRAVKKWSLHALQLRAQTNSALDLREKNAKRTFRKMFAYWHQKAIQRRPPKRIEEAGQLGSTARAETWSDCGGEMEIDEWARGVNEMAISTPIPGYLNTPSKRTERAMAVAARFSTTPKAPLSTPFERQLRAQYSGGGLQSLRKGRGRSALTEGFADIPESKQHIL
jgi:protein SFI1